MRKPWPGGLARELFPFRSTAPVPNPQPGTTVAMMGVACQALDGPLPCPSLGQMYMARGSLRLPVEFVFYIPAVLRAGACGCHHCASPEAHGEGGLEHQKSSAPCLRHCLLPRSLVTGAIVLPWPRPPQLFQTICSPAPHLLSLFKAGLEASRILGSRQQDGDS